MSFTSSGTLGKGVMTNTAGSSTSTLTGIPLFSQISAPANNSAVAAYSLRSLTGTTAKAVRVIRGGSGGDTITDSGGYRIHTFTSTGSSTFIPPMTGTVEVLIVAGGGGGGGGAEFNPGGGGGAGEFYESNTYAVTRGASYTVTVGGGGARGVGTATTGGTPTAGGDSSFGNVTCNGGGRGGANGNSLDNGGSGGSGGGASRTASGGSSVKTAPGGFGNRGGNSGGALNDTAGGGGGGGAGGAGAAASGGNSTRAAGGAGKSSSISGTSASYANGGDGGSRSGTSNGTSASSNTGDAGRGGDGGDFTGGTNGGSGGSGIVIVRYLLANVTQDFYADRFGNLLTTPVTGQTLANWLGSQTGYVTTWYDQTGKGNNAIKTVASQQPVIRKATKGPGYAILFNGTDEFLTGMSYTVLNNTNYSISIVERRNTNASNMWFVTSGNSGTTNNFLHLGYITNTSFRYGQYNNDMNITVPGYVSNEPLHYWTFTQSSTSGRYIFNQTTNTITSDATKTVLLSSTSGNFIIGARISGGSQYYSGEIYELIVFTSSLYDLDGTTSVNQIYNNQLSLYGT